MTTPTTETIDLAHVGALRAGIALADFDLMLYQGVSLPPGHDVGIPRLADAMALDRVLGRPATEIERAVFAHGFRTRIVELQAERQIGGAA